MKLVSHFRSSTFLLVFLFLLTSVPFLSQAISIPPWQFVGGASNITFETGSTALPGVSGAQLSGGDATFTFNNIQCFGSQFFGNLNGASYLNISFDQPQQAVGAYLVDVSPFDSVVGVTQVVYDQSNNVIEVESAMYPAWGYGPIFLGIGEPTAQISRVEWRFIGGGYFGVDNVVYGNANGLSQMPNIPTGLKAVRQGNQVVLSWLPADRAITYNIKRSSSSGGPYSVVGGGIAATNFTDAAVLNGGTYYYVVTAVNSYGESANSQQAIAFVVDHFSFAPIPTQQTSAVPFSVVISARDSNGITLTNFRSGAMLSGSGDHGPVAVVPDLTTAFQNGQWTGTVMIAVSTPDTNIRLMCNSNGVAGLSNPFNAAPNPIQMFNLTAADMVYDPFAERIYASVPSSAATYSNCLLVIDPFIGRVETSYYLGDNPGKLALSDNGQFLYIGFYGTSVFRRFVLATHSVDMETYLGDHNYYTWLHYYASQMAVLPGSPRSVAVAENTGYGADAQVVIFDDGVPRTNLLSGLASYSGTVVAASATRLYAGYPFTRATLNDAGVASFDSYGNLIGLSDLIKYQQGLVFTPGGRVFDPESLNVLGNLPSCSIVEPDLVSGRVFTMSSQPVWGQPDAWTLYACDPISLLTVGSLPIPGQWGGPTTLIRWGTNGLAFCTSSWYQNQIYLVRTSLVPSGSPAALSVTTSVDQIAATLYSNLTYTILITNAGPSDANGAMLQDVIPTTSTFVSASSSMGACVYSNTLLICNLGTLSSGSAATITLVIKPNFIGSMTNVAVVTSLSLDTVMSNNTAVTVSVCEHAPFVQTQSPWVQNRTNVTLNGMVTPNGLPTVAWFEWGLRGQFDQSSPQVGVGAGGQVLRINTSLVSATNDTVYQCRLVASNSMGIIYGSGRPFSVGRKILGWGDNSTGQIAIPSGLSNVVSLAAGRYHSLALSSDGTVAAWGGNSFGQTNVPAGLSNVVSIAAGDSDSLALRADGTVVAWGQSYAGQANVPGGLSGVVAIAQGQGHDLVLKSDGTLVAWGDNANGRATIPPGLTNVVAIAAGHGHNVALKSDGTVFSWGWNDYGQTNVPAGLENVVAVAGGFGFSIAILSDGRVVGWGGSGDAPVASNAVAIAAMMWNPLALRDDGTVVNLAGQAIGPVGLTNSSIIAAGTTHFLADGNNMSPAAASQTVLAQANQDNQVVLSGADSNGDPLNFRITTLPAAGLLYQSTNGIRGPVISAPDTPVSDPGHRIVLVPGPNAVGRPYTSFSFVANDGVNDSLPAVVAVNIDGAFAQTQSAQPVTQSNAVLNGMALPNGFPGVAWFEWGESEGFNHTSNPVNVMPSSTVVRISQEILGLLPRTIYQSRLVISNVVGVAYGGSVIFTTGAKITAWGAPSSLNTIPSGLSNVVTIAAGAAHGLALKPDGTVSAWGSNAAGQTTVPSSATNVVAIAAGTSHSVTLRADGTLVAWGSNSSGQRTIPSGLSNVVAIAAGANHNLALRIDGTVVAWGLNGSGQTNVPASLSNAVAVAAGQNHSLALRADGTIISWGAGSLGLANVPAAASNVIAIAAGDNHSVALRKDGLIVAWGSNSTGQTNVPTGVSNVVAIGKTANHTLAIKAGGSLVAWGNGSSGQTTIPAGVSNVATVAGAINNTIVAGANISPRAIVQSGTGPANRDLLRTLSGTDTNGDRLTFRVSALPTLGKLYQYTNGIRGPAFDLPNTTISDTNHRVIFVPGVNGFGAPYATFSFVVNDGDVDSTPGLVTISISPPVAPVLSRGSWDTNRSFELKLTGDSNTTYAIWASTNLVNWNLLGPATFLGNGSFRYLDLEATNWSQRFYKAGAPQ